MSVEISEIVALLHDQGFEQGASLIEEVARRLRIRGAIPSSVGRAELARRLLNERAFDRSDIDLTSKADRDLDRAIYKRQTLLAREIRERLDKAPDPGYGDE
jgi:hypothetical protein